jgi:hypothetical protein
MRTPHIMTGAALMAAFVVGCSKPHATTPPKMTDLGVVELTPKTPKQFSLGGSQSCTITCYPNGTNITVNLVVMTTNTDGSIHRSLGQMVTSSGRQCVFGLGDATVGLRPTWKTQ